MKTRIIYMVVDTARLTLYKEDGESVVIPQGDARVARILEEAMPAIQTNGYADVDLNGPVETMYSDYEAQSGGLVRFFRVAKSKLKSMLGMDAPQSDEQLQANVGYYGDPSKLNNAVLDVMAHAKPATSANIKNDETVVAVVNDTVLPDAQRLTGHIAHSVKTGSTQGMNAFFARIAKAIENRSHSVDGLLRFMEKGDLPVADDGTIIAYKLVYAEGEGLFVDPRTRKVTQRVGSFVCVDEKLVDTNRRQECSNGLHIARRDYLRGFHGDTCLLVKVAPEDVIAVPHGDPSKVRVCGYHIIDQLSDEAMKRVKCNQPMTGLEEAEAMLARAISGDHIGRIEEVRLTKQNGQGLIITPLDPSAAPRPTGTKKASSKVANAVALDDERVVGKAVAPVLVKAVNAKLKAAKAVSQEPQKMDNRSAALFHMGRIRSLSTPYAERIEAAQSLKAIKKTSKKGWDKLGITPADLKFLEEVEKEAPPPVKLSKKTKNLAAQMKAPAVAAAKAKPKANDNKPKPTDRDQKVLDLKARGKTVSEIARETGVSRRTVDRILDKFAA